MFAKVSEEHVGVSGACPNWRFLLQLTIFAPEGCPPTLFHLRMFPERLRSFPATCQTIPVPSGKFTVPICREFRRNALNLLLDLERKSQFLTESRKFPCKSLFIREIPAETGSHQTAPTATGYRAAMTILDPHAIGSKSAAFQAGSNLSLCATGYRAAMTILDPHQPKSSDLPACNRPHTPRRKAGSKPLLPV